MQTKQNLNKFIIFTIILFTCFTFNISEVYAVSVPSAYGQINSSNGVNIRKNATTKSNRVFGLKNNTSISIQKIIFTSKNKTDKKHMWFYISASGKTGYVRSDLIDGIHYSSITAKTTASISYRVGAGTGMKKKGTLKKGRSLNIVLVAKAKGSSKKWYRINLKGKAYYVCSDHIELIESEDPIIDDNKCDAAKALLQKPTAGGSVRVVYSFTTSNCSKKFSVKGTTSTHGGKVPQGMAFDGTNYYILFAMDDAQYIATYSSNGERLSFIQFDKDRNHLNGMTWDYTNQILLITKGNQYTIYTYDPVTETFGTASTKPYTNSGVAYDEINKWLYFTSKTEDDGRGVYTYDADGTYTHLSSMSRCSRSGTYYTQDCAAYNGFVFHCISTGSKTGNQNYIDVYRTKDSSYLGTIQFEMGEVESAVINANGYLEILVNTGSSDYIWETPLKVTDLE